MKKLRHSLVSRRFDLPRRICDDRAGFKVVTLQTVTRCQSIVAALQCYFRKKKQEKSSVKFDKLLVILHHKVVSHQSLNRSIGRLKSDERIYPVAVSQSQ